MNTPAMVGSAFYRRRGKRALDLGLTVAMLPCALLLILILGGLVWLRMGRPIFFRQIRAGRNGEPFRLVKLRTMHTQPSDGRVLLSDEQRLTSFGRFLRRWSLDELPELWNVLRGDMSLVGPRPLLVEYVPRYDARQGRRHDVLPGITGWAAVNGRNLTPWPDRMELDVWYTENLSLRLDVEILARTLSAVAVGAGVAPPGHATMSRFGEDEQ